jgi:hypothetical protein
VKIKNLNTKTSLEIEESDVLVIEDGEDTKQITVKEFKEYLIKNGISKNTKILINQMMDSVIESLKASKYVISELLTYRMNTTVNDVDGTLYITLQDTRTDRWLTVSEIEALLFPNEDDVYTKTYVISVLINDAYVRCSSYSIHDGNEIDEVMPVGNIGYIKAHFDGLSQNDVANITYDKVLITIEDTEIVIAIPVEDIHDYEFVGDPDMFNNNVPFVQNIG